jgi:NIPSNAP
VSRWNTKGKATNPALKNGGHDKKLVGYFQADTGTINQLVHLWKFDDDADRRKHWAGVFANKDFVEGFARSSGRLS